MDTPVSTELPPEVHAAELAEIRARRKCTAEAGDVTGGADPGPSDLSGVATTKNGLVGLAISGGGIRSSTFSLGVIQALARQGLFRHFDLLSTVSGGGYTGSLISCLLRDADGSLDSLLKVQGKTEPAALRKLRAGSNYLSPGGLAELARLPAVVVRGLLLNALLALPYLMLAVILTEVVHEQRYWLRRWLSALIPGPNEALFSALEVGFVVLLPIAVYAFLVFAGRGVWQQRDRLEKLFGTALVAGVLLLVVVVLNALLNRALQASWIEFADDVEAWMSRRWLALLWIVIGSVVLVAASKELARAVSSIAIYAAAIIGPAIVVGIYLLLVVAQADSPFLTKSYAELLPPTQASDQSTGFAGPRVLLPDFKRALQRKGIDYTSDTVQARWCPSTTPESAAWHFAPPRSLDPPDAAVCAVSNSEVAEVGYRFRFYPREGIHEIWGAGLHFEPLDVGWQPRTESAVFSDSTFFGIALLLLCLNYLFLDVNISSLHGFYRDRLSKLYLFRVLAGDVIEEDDEQSLSGLNRPGGTAPYHLLNATLNLGGEGEGRTSGFFAFGKRYTGGPRVGYCETGKLEDLDPRLNLGTAMAISAAAASPNMGRVTMKPLVFIMTLLNLRLGYWLPNPRRARKDGWKWSRAYRPRIWCLLKEAFGILRSSTHLINLSDGGHLENLGLYELLRRRCAVIVVIDGEEDADHTFGSLAEVVRLARIDLGVRVDVDLSRLRRTARGVSRSHCAMGTIDYGADGQGRLVYVKLSMTGDEEPDVADYAARNPAFPHQSTADQFFGEDQFEAYRALGEHVGKEVVDEFEELLTRGGLPLSPA